MKKHKSGSSSNPETDQSRADLGREPERAMYRIRVSGALGEEWSAWTGMTIKVIRGVESETTELTGTLPDQAALMGVLERLYSRGARLLSLEHLDS